MSEDRKIDIETQKMLDEAKALATSTLDGLNLDELVEFNGYRSQVENDYQDQERKWRERQSNEEVPFPVYRKLEPEGVKEKSWWPKVLPLFSEKDGQEASGLVMFEVGNYIHKKARENPLI